MLISQTFFVYNSDYVIIIMWSVILINMQCSGINTIIYH